MSDDIKITPDLDPQEVTEQPDYVAPESDPVGPEIVDTLDPNFVEPAPDAIRPAPLEITVEPVDESARVVEL